jgi:hypothetical protein
MHVELAIDSEFAAPAMVKALGDEVKAAKAWLQGRKTALVPQSLDREMVPIVPKQGSIDMGRPLLMIEDVPRVGAQDWDKVRFRLFVSSVVDDASDIARIQTPEVSDVVREVRALSAPPANMSPLVVGTKRRLFLSFDDEEQTLKKVRNAPKPKSSTKGSDGE